MPNAHDARPAGFVTASESLVCFTGAQKPNTEMPPGANAKEKLWSSIVAKGRERRETQDGGLVPAS